MVHAILLAALLSVPTDAPLWRLDGVWVYPPKYVADSGRTAPATIIVFRKNGEFIEHHCWVIEGKKSEMYISSGDPHVVVVGTWHADGEKILVRRLRVDRTVQAIGADPLCQSPEITLTLRGDGVYGDFDEGSPGLYRRLEHLLSPDFEAYVTEAKQSRIVCGAK